MITYLHHSCGRSWWKGREAYRNREQCDSRHFKRWQSVEIALNYKGSSECTRYLPAVAASSGSASLRAVFGEVAHYRRKVRSINLLSGCCFAEKRLTFVALFAFNPLGRARLGAVTRFVAWLTVALVNTSTPYYSWPSGHTRSYGKLLCPCAARCSHEHGDRAYRNLHTSPQHDQRWHAPACIL